MHRRNIDPGAHQRLAQIADNARRRTGENSFPFELLGHADIRPADQTVVPVILGLRQKGQTVIAARAIHVGLVVQTAEELVFTTEQ